MIHVGVDWAEAHHQVCLLDGEGELLDEFTITDGVSGVRMLHERIGAHTDEPDQVVVGIEIDRGLRAGPPGSRSTPRSPR
jgi:hypothetical protein